jgi:N-acetylglutamate synthase
MTDQIHLLEELGINTWAALQTQVYDGWLLRFSGGFTRRANSVQVLYPPNLPLEEKIAFCENTYWNRGLPVTFKLTEAAQPADLDAQLGERGYNLIAQTVVQARSLEGINAEDVDLSDITVSREPELSWLDLYFQANDVEVAHYGIARHMMSENRMIPATFVTIWNDAIPAGVAMLAVERGYAGLFDVAVSADQRGQGYGKRLMVAVLGIAKQQGAHSAYLQVMEDNEAALQLYDGLGFSTVYKYWYRQKQVPTG